jgi:hypothetical protein
MPFPTTLPAAILDTILTHLAAFFLTGAAGDPTTARHAAAQMLAAYHPQTEDELRLAASIIGFSFQALEALAQSAAPNLPITRILRLRGSAVSLSREAHKAERRLAQLQKPRPQPIPIKTEEAAAPIETPTKTAPKPNGQSWTRMYEQRQRDIRLAARLKKAETAALPTPSSQAQPMAHAI